MGWFNDNMDSDGSEFGYKDPPNHIDPATGYIKTGYRKCSNCTSYKYRTGFTKEEAKKPAAKRLCNDCIATGATTVKSKPKAPATSTKTSAATTNNKSVIPQLDIKCMSIKEMKEELESHGVCTKAMIEKSELIDALTNARESTKCSSLTLVDIQALTVQGLKEELKSRGLPVSGLKAVLQQRLIDAVGVSTCTTESSGKEALTEEAPVKKTVAPEKTASKAQNKENVPQTKGNDSKKTAKKESKEQKKENGLKERVKRCSGCSNILLNKYTQICGTCVSEAKESAGGGNGKQPKLPYPCKFFSIGQCRYGDACRFSHALPGATGFGGSNSTGGHGQTYRGSIWSHPDVIAGMKSYRASKPSWDWNR
jgi:hypothetical protein